MVAHTSWGHDLFDYDGAQHYFSELTARTFTVSTHHNDLERQARDTQVIHARTKKGSQWQEPSRIYRMEDGAEAVWLEVRLRFGPGEISPHGYDHEVAMAMAPLWASWWLCDIDAGLMEAPIPVVAVAADLIALGTEWRTAVAMAVVEDEHRLRHIK